MKKNTAKRIWIPLIFLFIWGLPESRAQFRWDLVVGGGYSDLEIPFSGFGNMELLRGSASAKAGTSISGSFREEGRAGWQIGLQLQNTGFRSIPIDWEKAKEISGDDPVTVTDRSDFPRDYSRTYRKRNWELIAPVSLTLDVFHPVQLLIGADFDYMLSTFPEKDKFKINFEGNLDPRFKALNVAGHLGLFADINPRLRLQGKIFSDITPRLNYYRGSTEDEIIEKGYRRIGFSIEAHYQVN